MPRPRNPVPSYRLHKQSAQAVVTVSRPGGGRRDILLGAYDSPESKAEYRRILSELAAGTYRPGPGGTSDATVSELALAFWRFAEGHYPAPSLDDFRQTFRALRLLYGGLRAADFGPLTLKTFRDRLVAGGLARTTVNKRVGVAKRLFKWAVGEELVPPSVSHALAAVPGLRKGRTAARETEPVGPVAEAVVRATLPFLPAAVAGLAEFQLLTGCRPGEACRVRPADIDTSGAVWLYTPPEHKTAHRGKRRVIAVGPKAQAVLARFAPADPADHYFSPRRTMAAMYAARAAAKRTPARPAKRATKGKGRKRPPGCGYRVRSYSHAVRRACEKAGVPHWHPHQLRHTHATAVRKRFGLEAVQATLGHAKADVSELYAQKNTDLATTVALAVG